MKDRRRVYHLNVSKKQMKELQVLISEERQRVRADHPNGCPKASALKGLQKALENAEYFYEKHKAEEEQKFRENEEEQWFSENS